MKNFDYKTLKVGDRVMVSSYGASCNPDIIGVVTKVSKTLIEVDGQNRYRVIDGSSVHHEKWSGTRIYELTEKEEKRLLHERLIRHVKYYAEKTNFNSVSKDDLIILKSIFDKYKT